VVDGGRAPGCQIPHFIAVHAVESLQPGLYRWPSFAEPLRRGELRQELHHACLDQELGRDAAFFVIAAIDLGRLDDRGYRDAHLEAGLIDGRLHLVAFAFGVGASRMTFLDPAIPPLLGEPLAGLLLTCIGVPSYRHRPGRTAGRARQNAPSQTTHTMTLLARNLLSLAGRACEIPRDADTRFSARRRPAVSQMHGKRQSALARITRRCMRLRAAQGSGQDPRQSGSLAKSLPRRKSHALHPTTTGSRARSRAVRRSA
jgi:hypothetical protein